MIWFFDRDCETTACEVRRDRSAFEIAVRGTNGTETVHQAEDAPALLLELETTARRLIADGWHPRPIDRAGSVNLGSMKLG